MATYNQVSYGSQGSSVTELQKLLNKNGYNLSEDGIFGTKTQAAVEDYQKKSGLYVDGIAGNDTWGALTKVTAPAPTAAPSSNASAGSTKPNANQWSYDPFKVSGTTAAADQKRQELASQKPGEFTYGEYEKSDVVKQAEAMLQQQLANKPGAYQSAWQTQLDETLKKILNREDFSYDLNGDALYQQYKDQYMQQGQQAMMDTMGQAAALTGGYGSSYAQSVGQQAYQGYLQKLNNVVPELYQLALDQYKQEGQDLYNQYGLYADRENQDYGRYRDSVSDYYAELDRLTEDARYQGEQDYSKYVDARNLAYGVHRDNVSDWQNEQARADEDYWKQYNRDYAQYADERNLSYQQNRDEVSDQQWQAQFDEAMRQYNEGFQYQQDRDKVADQQWQAQFDEAKRQYNQEYDLALKKYYASLSSGSSSDGDGDSDDAGEDQIQLYDYAYQDTEKGITYFNYDGKTIAVETGVNPYTRTKNPDAQGEGNAFSNGYQPNNIGGDKLKKVDGEAYNMNGRVQNVWTVNGKYYVWDGTKNKYVQITMRKSGSTDGGKGGGLNVNKTQTLH